LKAALFNTVPLKKLIPSAVSMLAFGMTPISGEEIMSFSISVSDQQSLLIPQSLDPGSSSELISLFLSFLGTPQDPSSSGMEVWECDHMMQSPPPESTTSKKARSPQPATSEQRTDSSTIAGLYPEAYVEFRPQSYDHIKPDIAPDELEKLTRLDAKDLIQTLKDDERLEFNGEGGSDLEQSITRLVGGSPTFRQALMTGLSVDKAYTLYADTYDNMDAAMREKGLDLEQDLSKMPPNEWSAFALLDTFLENKDQQAVPYNNPEDAFFNTPVIANSGTNFEKSLDRTVAHEFGHLTLNTTDGDVGDVGSNQIFVADIMREMGYAISPNIIPTYGTGAESLLVEDKMKESLAGINEEIDTESALNTLKAPDNNPYFIPDYRHEASFV
jgi:hypothetical protein